MNKEEIDYKIIMRIIFISILFYFILFNLKFIISFIGKIINILYPFILGTFIALVVNIPMRFFENKFSSKKNKISKKVRIFSLLISLLLILSIFVIIVLLVVPKLFDVVKSLIDNIPYYKNQIIVFYDMIDSRFLNLDVSLIKDNLINELDELNTFTPILINSSFDIARNVIGSVVNFAIGIVFAIYLLMDKEKIKNKSNKIIKLVFKKKSDFIIKVESMSVNSFSNYVTAQLLESLILGVLSTFGLLVLRVPYAVMIGVLIGATALIPLVGTFIGIIIGSILIVSVSPIHVLVFLIYQLVLQQIEGNLIYPRVVGNRVGLPGIIVLFAITIGASIMGFYGIILAIPLVSVVYSLLREKLNEKE